MAGASRLAALAVALGAVAATPVTDGALRVEVDRLTALVAAARHLPAHGPVPAHLVSGEAAARQLALALGAGLAAPSVSGEAEMLRRLGLLPAGTAADEWLARALTPARPEARYDPTTGTLLVPDDAPLDAQRPVLIHEIAHALGDQRFGLRQFLQIAPGGARQLDADAQRARLGLVEGDATLATLATLDPHESFLGRPALGALEAQLRAAFGAPAQPSWPEQLAEFTHVDGWLFVARARARRPWSAVDALWADPPASTEQILHPDRYDECDAPIAVDPALLPALPGFGRPQATEVLGELVVRAWLRLALPREIAERGATGWGGDRAGLYNPATSPASATSSATAASAAGADAGTAPGSPVVARALAWLTVWDDAGEADDFARGATAVMAVLANTSPDAGPEAAAARDGRATFRSPAGVYALERAGAAVALLLAAPEAALPTLDEMLDGWRRHEGANRRRASHPASAARPGCRRRDRAAEPP